MEISQKMTYILKNKFIWELLNKNWTFHKLLDSWNPESLKFYGNLVTGILDTGDGNDDVTPKHKFTSLFLT